MIRRRCGHFTKNNKNRFFYLIGRFLLLDSCHPLDFRSERRDSLDFGGAASTKTTHIYILQNNVRKFSTHFLLGISRVFSFLHNFRLFQRCGFAFFFVLSRFFFLLRTCTCSERQRSSQLLLKKSSQATSGRTANPSAIGRCQKKRKGFSPFFYLNGLVFLVVCLFFQNFA